MEIKSSNKYPSCALSNFAPHPFVLDGVECKSMIGFLQSLKFESQDMQKYVCTLVGMAAKKKGINKKWFRKQELYWNGVTYKRDSDEYQNLLNRAYNALYQNEGFRKALMSTKGSNLTHAVGKTKTSETVLTASEFCSRLMKLRDVGLLPTVEPEKCENIEQNIYEKCEETKS